MKTKSLTVRNFLSASVFALAIAGATPALALTEAGATAATPVAAPAAPPAATQTAWGIEVNDLKPDPAARYGVLPNGMKYAIQKNETPKGAAAVRFNIDVGMGDEMENERGLAHFLEHLAFNGSKNIPEGELIKKLERLGLAFGADTNAMTGPDATTYILDLPKANEETVDAALLMMREVAGELTIAPAAVDRERGIIMAEAPTRDVPGRRRIIHWLSSAIPDNPIGGKLAFGDGAMVKTAPAERIRAFYHGFYRPERATLTFVGDFDVDQMDAKIRKAFSNWKAVGPARTRTVPAVTDRQKPIIANFVDASTNDVVELQRFANYSYPKNTVADRRQDMLKQIATGIMSQRLSKLGRAPGSKISGGAAAKQDLFRATSAFGTIVVAKDGDWKSALETAEQETRKAVQFGFTQGELDEALANVANDYRSSAQQAASRSNGQIADSLVSRSVEKRIGQSPADNLAMFEKIAPSLTLDAVNTAYRAAWGNGPTLVHLSSKAPIADMEQSVAAVLAGSSKVAVSAPVDESVKAFAYENFGRAGKVVADKRIADLGIRTVRFANGVKLNIKKTDFEPGVINFGMRVGSGLMTFPKDKPGLPLMQAITSTMDGLAAHSIDELQKINAGRSVSMGINPDEDAFTSSGATKPQDLDRQLKLLAASITAPGFRPETGAQWTNVVPIIINNLSPNVYALHEVALPQIMSGGDGRLGLVDIKDLAKLDLASLKAAVEGQLKTGAVEIALVGDVDEAKAIELVSQTFGAIPKRPLTSKVAAAQAKASVTTDRSVRTLYHSGKEDLGLVSLNWPTTDDKDTRSDIARLLLAEIMGLELTEVLREQLGATYSPSAASYSSPAFAGYGYVSAIATTPKDKMEIVTNAMKGIAKKMREAPPTDDQLLRARKPMAERYAKQVRENGAWISVVGTAQSQPRWMERRRQREAILASITPADIQAMAKKYLADPQPIEVRVISKGLEVKPQ